MQNQNSQLELNVSLFDHGIFPVSQKWGLLNLYNFYQKLIEKCDPTKKINQQLLKQLLIQNIPCFNQIESDAYITVYRQLVTGNSNTVIQQQQQQYQQQQQQLQQQQQNIDIKKFTVFLFVQMYTSNQQRQSTDQSQQSLKRSQFQEGIKGNNKENMIQYSPMNSPRSKTIRQSTSEYQQITFFIKYNLKTILKLISSEETIDSSQIEGISILFKNGQILSSMFQGNKKWEINEISSIICEQIYLQIDNKNVITGLTRSVQIKDEEFCEQNGELKIQNCEDSQILIMGICENIQIQNCSNVSVFCLGVKRVCSVDKCENINLTLTASILRIGNTIDSSFYYYGPNGPILYGDNRTIQLGPHNANYIHLPYAIKDIDMQLTSQLAIKFQDPIILNNNKNNFKIIKPKEINMCVLPGNFMVIEASRCKDFEKLRELVTIPKSHYKNSSKHMGVIIPVLSPGEYKQEVYLRYKNMMEFQKKISEQQYKPEEIQILHMAIQGHFREWLVNTGSYKQVNELLRMIDQDQQYL